MKQVRMKRSKFKLKKFLDALHMFSLDHCADGDPLPVVSGSTVYSDDFDLIDALAADEDRTVEEIPRSSLERLKMGLKVFGTFAFANGFDEFDCADGEQVEVPNLDDEEEEEDADEEPRRRTEAYLEMVANTVCDECTAYGYVISLDGDTVKIEGKCMRDVSGDCELEEMVGPNLLEDGMRRWLNSFLFPKRRRKA
jgi:hypothetical protein